MKKGSRPEMRLEKEREVERNHICFLSKGQLVKKKGKKRKERKKKDKKRKNKAK